MISLFRFKFADNIGTVILLAVGVPSGIVTDYIAEVDEFIKHVFCFEMHACMDIFMT